MLDVAEKMADGLANAVGLVGYGVATVCDASGEVVQEVPFANLVTTVGDKYYAQIAAKYAGSADNPSAVTGMKLGTSQTAASKSGAGAYIGTGTYLSTSNNTFDVTTVASAVTGTDTGWQVGYECFWGSGDVTSATIWEVALVSSTGSNTGDADANSTIARVKFPTVIDKSGAGYTLRVTWYHKLLGA